MTEDGRYSRVFKRHDPPAGLDERVMERVESLRAAAPRSCPQPRAYVSRRALVTAGARAVAGLGVGGAALLRLVGGGSGGDAGRPAAPSERAFGLQVAYASNGASGEVFSLEPTARGLVPVSAGRMTQLLLNLVVEGEDIEGLEYRIAETPHFEETNLMAGETEATEVASVAFVEGKRVVKPFVADQPDVSFATEEEARAWSEETSAAELMWGGDEAATSDSELAIDYGEGIVAYAPAVLEGAEPAQPQTSFAVDAERHASGNDGMSERGNPYLLEIALPSDSYYAIDPVVALVGAYNEAHARYLTWSSEHPDEARSSVVLDPEGRELEQASRDAWGAASRALGELRSGPVEEFYDWMKTCYGACMDLVGATLEDAVVTVEASFADGTSALRAYRFVRADGFAEAVSDRFDALFEYNGFSIVSCDGVFNAAGQRVTLGVEGAPFWDFVAGEPDPDYDDERLRVSLFSIADVTDEWEGSGA